MIIRFILDEPRGAAENMAVDEVLMEQQQNSSALPALRIYFWKQPAYSIGYFQDVRETMRRYRCAEKGIEVVRRPTGGGLVLHGKDLTFSLTLRAGHPRVRGDVRSSYLKINEVVLAGLRKADPKLDFADCKPIPSGRGREGRVCFETHSCYDLLSGEGKVVGSSQRRRGGAVLHQSSVFLDRERVALARIIRQGFEEKWNAEFMEIPLAREELDRALERKKNHYSSSEWFFSV